MALESVYVAMEESYQLRKCWSFSLAACAIALALFLLSPAFEPTLQSASVKPAVRAGHVNERPVLAILASDCDGLYNCSTYIPASYVRWLQQGGAQVVALHRGMNEDEFMHVLSHVNGVLMIGGFFKMNGTAEPHIRRIWEHAVKLGEENEFFPLWATCVGIHDMVQLASGKVYGAFLEQTAADNLALPLNFSDGPSVPLIQLFNDARLPGSEVYRQWLESHAIT
eukprot:TRINITY_DN23822_c0_g1_i1.p1 TRINITY_DN23822_c0_g1~~TRINITY_DN23822_c0_g1_i1.p1  ORF type:complete len:225 (+),score=19.60 TRINITY_DN23822_c0_g1_i1:72-746(+)